MKRSDIRHPTVLARISHQQQRRK